MILVNGVAENRIAIADRGLQYGDGLFETIAFRDGKPEFIEAHLQRLILGCQRLHIPFLQLAELHKELDAIFQHVADTDSVIKIIITRGCGGRGYFSDKNVEPTRIISTHDYPNHPETHSTSGISVYLCHHKLSENPALAGLKHLNRLDNVLARNEWDDNTIAEGLMFDQSNHLIEGTMSNVFIIKSQQLITPLLNKSGVAGIMRAQVIALAKHCGLSFKESVVSYDDLKDADEVFVCNSVNGIWPVVEINNTVNYSVGPITQQLQHDLSKVSR